MNKYVRTRDGIYEIIKDIEEIKLTTARIPNCFGVNEEYVIDNNKIVAKADTIEELCDAIITFENTKPNVHLPCNEHNVSMLKKVYFDNRFAIWTDKGLIYIAKMDVKGKMVLL